jgi:hypothetical protein
VIRLEPAVVGGQMDAKNPRIDAIIENPTYSIERFPQATRGVGVFF